MSKSLKTLAAACCNLHYFETHNRMHFLITHTHTTYFNNSVNCEYKEAARNSWVKFNQSLNVVKVIKRLLQLSGIYNQQL